MKLRSGSELSHTMPYEVIECSAGVPHEVALMVETYCTPCSSTTEATPVKMRSAHSAMHSWLHHCKQAGVAPTEVHVSRQVPSHCSVQTASTGSVLLGPPAARRLSTPVNGQLPSTEQIRHVYTLSSHWSAYSGAHTMRVFEHVGVSPAEPASSCTKSEER